MDSLCFYLGKSCPENKVCLLIYLFIKFLKLVQVVIVTDKDREEVDLKWFDEFPIKFNIFCIGDNNK